MGELKTKVLEIFFSLIGPEELETVVSKYRKKLQYLELKRILQDFQC